MVLLKNNRELNSEEKSLMTEKDPLLEWLNSYKPNSNGETTLADTLHESTSLAVMGVCESCEKEKPVQTLYGTGGNHESFCFDCANALIAPEEVSFTRVPNEWEVSTMSEHEKNLYAENGYVTFEQRLPDEPYLIVTQESQDGELQYKDIVLCDPDYRYMSGDDVNQYKKRLRYNGGPFAYLLQGTISAGLMYGALCVSVVINPAVAMGVWLGSLPFSWKLSKKLTNIINEKVVLPYELEARRELIEGRRKDEKVRQQVYIETL